MYGTLVNQVDVFEMKVEQGERLLQEQWRFGYLKSAQSQCARTVWTRVLDFLRNALGLKGASARSVNERLSY